MKIEKCIKESFVVIGKEGSTLDGEKFILKLWNDFSDHFQEIEHLAKKDEDGNLLGFWGVMNDFSYSFKPWEKNYTQGLYLAGVECNDDAQPPAGWTKWVIPGYKFLRILTDKEDALLKVLDYLTFSNIDLAGGIHDFTCPKTGKDYMFIPVAVIGK
ncbi:MAG TPA: GyrI-like domain-containing protein [Erysipelotrichaceae bacterium]|nr:GyrI-like domain-containing protein [Erysipelotrichaceae bacterium]